MFMKIKLATLEGMNRILKLNTTSNESNLIECKNQEVALTDSRKWLLQIQEVAATTIIVTWRFASCNT